MTYLTLLYALSSISCLNRKKMMEEGGNENICPSHNGSNSFSSLIFLLRLSRKSLCDSLFRVLFQCLLVQETFSSQIARSYVSCLSLIISNVRIGDEKLTCIDFNRRILEKFKAKK